MCISEVTKSVRKLLSMDNIVMSVLLSILAWGVLEVIGHNEALATLQEKHLVIDRDSVTITETKETLMRMEINQKHYNIAINKDITHIKESLTILSERVDSQK